MRQQSPRRELSVAAAVSLVLVSAHLNAQESARRSSQNLEEVIVTGSHIEGTPEDAALPVEVITMDDLENLGRPTNMDLVRTLSEVGQMAGEADRSNLFPVGAASVNLRNLGSRFTTVVFNGRRFPEQFASIGRFNNINWIPNAALGRIEILKEGGAATYGADAIGGVVNYITRTNLDGFEVSADYRYIEDSDGDYTADFLWGNVFDRGNILVSSGYEHRSTLNAMDRHWATRHYLENNLGWSANGSPGSYILQTRTTPAGAPSATTFTSITPTGTAGSVNRYTGNQQMGGTGYVRDPQCAALGGFAGWSTTPNPVCYFQAAQFEKLVEKSNTYNIFAELNYNLTDAVQFHGEALYLQQELPEIATSPSDAPLAFPLIGGSSTARQTIGATAVYYVDGHNPAVTNFLNTFRNADGSPALSQAQISSITNTGRVALPSGAWRPFGNGGHPLSGRYDIQENKAQMWRLTTALSGELPEFWGTNLKWEVATTYSHVKDRKEAQDMLVNRLQAALNGLGGANCNGIRADLAGSTCQWFNPFSSTIARNVYMGASNPGYVGALQNSPDLVRWLYQPIWLERTYESYILDPVINGTTGWTLPGGPVAIAVGGQFRWGSEETQMNELSNRDLNPCATPGLPESACDSSLRTGPFVFTRPFSLFSTTEETRRIYPVAAAFAEVQLPLLPSLNLQLAGRFEKFYSDVTEKDNEVLVPAGAIKWQPLSWLAFRTSAGKTFSQVNPPKDDGPIIGTSIGSPTFGLFGSTTNSTTYTTANYDNVDVEPEDGSYLDVGVIIQAGNFSATVDYFDIRIDNYARSLTSGNIIAALVQPGQTPAIDNLINCSSPLFGPQDGLDGRPFVELNGPCVQGSSRLNSAAGGGGLAGGRMNYWGGVSQTNGGELKTTGIDLTASYAFDNVFGGVLRPSVDVSYVLEWRMGDYVLFGVPVARGYDAVGFRNQSAGRTGSQAVPEYRAGIGLSYSRGRHTINATARYIPSIVNEDITDFDASNDQNANIGNANGVVTSGAGTAAACSVPSSGLTGNLDSIPAGTGTGQFGGGSVGATNVVGFCGNHNTAILSGRTIKSTSNVDVTYRVELPAETDVSFTVYNLLNREPSFERQTLSYSSGWGSPLERNFKVSIKKRF